MILNQSLLDSTVRNQVYLERLKAEQVGRFTKFLREIDRDLRERLTRDDLTTFSRTRLEKLLVSVNQNLKVTFDKFRDEFEGDLVDIAEYESEFEARALENAIEVDGFESVIPSPNQVKSAIFTQPLSVRGADGGKLLTPFVKDWTQKDRARVIGTIRQGFFEGQTNFQIIQALRGTKARNYQDGVLGVVGRNAEAIVRTSVQHVASVARFETWEQNKQVVQGYEWVSTLDSKTTQICQGLDGQGFKLGGGPKPPAHIRCRSTTIATLDPKYDFLKEGRTRSSRGPDGKSKATADQDYFEWLKKQPAAFQDDALGPVKAKLFRDGGLTPERFRQLQLNKKFQPLTLEEIRRKEPNAFKKAFGDPDKTPNRVTPPKAEQRNVVDFQPQPTTGAVKSWLESNKYADVADFGKVDASVANEMAQSWVYHVERFPELRKNMGFMGSMQSLNRANYDRQLAYYMEQARQYYPDDLNAAEKMAKRFAKRVKSAPRAWAQAMPDNNHRFWKGLHGITFNEKYGSKKALGTLQKGLKDSLESKFHPVGCDTVKSIMDHEVGHQLDYLLGLAKKPEVVDLWKKWGGNPETLSRYARENIQEFIAESWAEYLNNPQPRRIAKQLGEILEKTYNEKFPKG